ncbi:UNVERIFIED_CONTAM: hypothetical protein Sradi_7247000, partial [Sesamum radiatum]
RSSFACSLRPLRSGFEPPNRQSELSGSVSFSKPCVGWGKRAFPSRRIQSSHRFPYGYLVTTSPQSKTPPWYAPISPPKAFCGTSVTQKSWVIIGPMLRAKPIPRV